LIGFVAKRTVGEASRWAVLIRLELHVHDEQRSLGGTALSMVTISGAPL
jgi:hypothetical protein